MGDTVDNFLNALKGNSDERLPVRVRKNQLGHMSLTASILGEELPSQEEAGNALLRALQMGMAEPSEIASEGRLADPRPLDAQEPRALADGTIEAGYDPLINAPGLMGDLKKDELVEPRARKAVEFAQSQGVRTVSSGFDEATGMGWTIGINAKGETVRIEAKPDDVFDSPPDFLRPNAPPPFGVLAAPDDGDQPNWLRPPARAVETPKAPAPSMDSPDPNNPYAPPKPIEEMTDEELTAYLDHQAKVREDQDARVKRVMQEQDERIKRGEPLLMDPEFQAEFNPAVTDIEITSAGTVARRAETPSQKVVRLEKERKQQEGREFRYARDLAWRLDGIKPGDADRMFRVKPADGVWKQGAPVDRRKVVEFLISKERLFKAALDSSDGLIRVARFGQGVVKGVLSGIDPADSSLVDDKDQAFFEEVSARQKDADGFWGRFLNDTIPNVLGSAPGMVYGAKTIGLPATMALSGAAGASLESNGDLGQIGKAATQGAIQGKVAAIPVPGVGSNALTKGTSIIAGEAATNVAGSIISKTLTGDADQISGEGLAGDALLGGTMATRRMGEVVRTKTTGLPATDPARVGEMPRGERMAVPPPDPILGDTAPAELAAPTELGSSPKAVLAVKVSDLPTPEFKGTPTGSQEVINAVADILARPLRFGRTPGKGGVYKLGPDVARARSVADIYAAIHEVGHQLFETTLPQITGDPNFGALRAELLDLGKALYGKTKPKGGYLREGYAEFFRKWISEPDTIAKDAPFLTKWFESGVTGDVRTAIDNARNVTTQYRTQGKVNLVKSMLAPATGKASLLRRFADYIGIGDSFVRKWVEAGAPFDQLAKYVEAETGQPLRPSRNPFKVFTYLNKHAGARAQHFIENGITDFAGNVVGPSLDQVVAVARGAASGKGLPLSAYAESDLGSQQGSARTAATDKLFQSYLYARHAVDVWNAEASGAKRLSPGGPGIDLETAQATVAALDSPRFQEGARLMRDYTEGLMDYVVQSGALTLDQVQRMRELYPNYMPLHRVMDDFAQDVGLKGRGTGGSPLRTLKGSGRRVRDPWQQMVELTEKWIDFAHKHKLAQTVANLRNVPGIGHFIEEVPAIKTATAVPVGRVKGQLEDIGADLTNADLDAVLLHFETDYAKSDKEAVLPINVGGKTKMFRLDPTLYEALSEVDVKRLHPAIDWIFGKPKRAFVLGTTGLNAGFSWFTNLLRDLPTALMQSKTTQTTDPATLLRASAELTGALAKATVGGVKGSLGGDRGRAIDQAERLGVQRARLMGTDTNATKHAAKNLGRAGLDWKERMGTRLRHPIDSMGSMVDWMREFFSIPETAMRAAEVERVLALKGKKPGDYLSLDDAIDVAIAGRQVTVDFSAAGTAARAWNELTPFFNVGIQGTRSMTRTFKQNPKAAMLKGFVGITVPTLLLWWKNKDEEWYRDMPWSERFTHWHTGAGDEVLRVPKGQEWANVFANIPTAIMQSIYDQDPKAAEEIIRHLSKTAPGPTGVPLGAVTGEAGERLADLMPQTAQVGLEQALNRDLFRDAPIVSRSFDGMTTAEQHDQYTTKFAKWLGNVIDWSPKRIDHLVSGFLGSQPKEWMDLAGMGDEADRDFEPTDIPIVGRGFRRGGKDGTRSLTVETLYKAYEALAGRKHSETEPLSQDERQHLANLEAAKAQIALFRKEWSDEPNREKRSVLQRKARAWAKWALDGGNPDKQPESYEAK